MKKRILSILLCVSMTAAMLIGCGSSEETTEDAAETTEETVEDTTEETDVEDRTVFVTPEWVQSVLDGEEADVEKYVLAEVSWGGYATAEAYNTAHVPGAIHINSDAVEYDDCDPWPEGDGIDDIAQYDEDFNYGLNEVAPEDNFNLSKLLMITSRFASTGRQYRSQFSLMSVLIKQRRL